MTEKSVLHAASLSLHCLVMFFYMSYNVWIIVSLIAGCGIGFRRAKLVEARMQFGMMPDPTLDGGDEDPL